MSEYDLPKEERFKSIITFLQQNAAQLEQERHARKLQERRRSDAEIDLTVVTHAVDDAKNQLTANMEAYRLHERQIDNEVIHTYITYMCSQK